MAFIGYEVTRRNMFNPNVCDVSGYWWDEKQVNGAIDIFKREHKVGDCISVTECYTEDNPYELCYMYLDPIDHEWKEC